MENSEVQTPDSPEQSQQPALELPAGPAAAPAAVLDTAQLKAILEAVIYVTDEPLSADQIATALRQPAARIGEVLAELTADYNRPDRGLTIREVAGGYKMSTKPEHHEAVRAFVKNLKPPLKLSLPALETLALIAYKQPITAPEIMEVRGVQGAGVLKTLLDRKLIAAAGRKQVVGKPILYKTTREFLVQFGLKDLSELPTLKEFEELGRLSMADSDLPEAASDASAGEQPAEAAAQSDPASPPESAASEALSDSTE
ncbi:MAG TPA: SMC-Scp complex subunit ScpB [Bryobacteraceae bacterium]|nr:SMC-Scp complex subunit ScpB [Bryobacteraceae bacterium]